MNIIFDLDGTLLNTLEDLKNATNYALRQYNLPERSLDEIRQFVGNGVRNLIIRAVPEGEAHPKFEDIFATFKAYYADHSLDATKPYDGILEILPILKAQGHRMAIVSNKLETATEELRKHFFSNYIEVAVGDVEYRKRKPAPDGVFEAIARLNANNESVSAESSETKTKSIYIGDSDVDFNTARNAGLPCISVLWGFRDKEFLQSLGAQIFAEKPSDLPMIINRLS